MSPADASFRPAARLHDGRDYTPVFNRQQKAAGPHVVVLLRPRDAGKDRASAPIGRLGIMVSTKVSAKAVRRHQLKRWVREWFRLGLKETLAGYDVVVLFRADPAADAHRLLDEEITALARRALAAAPQGSGGRRDRRPQKRVP
ncbi:MAG: ribonuclease P protein component [Planctomycetes bacterium]|nr:ribonuclease P protein component [Planctomycetota bacterium]